MRNHGAATNTAAHEPPVLWDVVEEHFDEAAFGLEQLDRMLAHPLHSLADLQRYPEERLLAHVDGLVVSGAPCRDRLLWPVLAGTDSRTSAHATVAAIALLRAGEEALLWAALAHADEAVRAAALRGGQLSASPLLDGALVGRLQAAQSPGEKSALLKLLALRQHQAPPLFEALQAASSDVLCAAIEAARLGDAQRYRPLVEQLLDHTDEQVQDKALVTSLAWGSQIAWRLCHELATRDGPLRARATALLSMLGGRAEHAQLVAQLAQPECRKQILFVLGFSGNATLIPVLLEHVASRDAQEAKLAAQSIAALTGIDLHDDQLASSVQLPQRDGPSLPALAEDDLDADLVPWPEDALPLPDPEAVAAAVAHTNLPSSRQRCLHGLPWTTETLITSLESAPLRRRPMLALALYVCSGGALQLDTLTFTAQQFARLRELRRAAQPTRLQFLAAL